MMSESMPGGKLRFTLTRDEGLYFQALLVRLSDSYENPKEATRAYWEGRISVTKPNEENGLEDAQEMLKESRGELRSERSELCKSWLVRLQNSAKMEIMTFDLKPNERDEFVAILNDRRLGLALETGLWEAEMQTTKVSELAPPKRAAVTEVDRLAKWISAVIGPQF
jgi:hypothetical protein